MEKDVELGSVAKLALSFSAGKAQASVVWPTGSVALEEDALGFVDLLKEALEKAIPASTPIDEAIFPALKALVASIK